MSVALRNLSLEAIYLTVMQRVKDRSPEVPKLLSFMTPSLHHHSHFLIKKKKAIC